MAEGGAEVEGERPPDDCVTAGYEDGTLEKILGELALLRAECGLDPPSRTQPVARGSVALDMKLVNGQELENTGDEQPSSRRPRSARGSVAVGSFENRASQAEAFSRLLSRMSGASSSRGRAEALALVKEDEIPWVSCDQLSRVFRLLKLPSELVHAAHMIGPKISDPENICTKVLPILSASTTNNCTKVLDILLT